MLFERVQELLEVPVGSLRSSRANGYQQRGKIP